MNNKDNKKDNRGNKIIDIKNTENIRIEFDPSFAMGPLVDMDIIMVKDRNGNKVRILCTDAEIKDKQEVVGIHPEIGVSSYNIKGGFYNSGESEYDLHLEYNLELAKKKFGYDVLAAIGLANEVFGDPCQYSPAEQKMIMEMCAMLMS